MFEKLKSALGDIRSEHSVLIKKREKLLQRREDLQSLPITKEDFINLMLEGVDAQADEYHKKTQLMVDNFNGKGIGLKTTHQVANLPFFAPWQGGNPNTITTMAIFALLGDELKVSLSKVVSNLDWPEAGPTIPVRKKELKKIDQDLSKLDNELAELNSIANQAGIQLTGMTIGQNGKKLLPGEVRPK